MEEKLNMAESSKKSKNASFTTAELEAKRAKYKKAGLSKSEINTRLNQAISDRRSNSLGAVQRPGLVLAPSRRSEVFRPNYNVRNHLPSEQQRRERLIRAQNVEGEILAHQRALADAKKHRDLVALRGALKRHPKEADIVRNHVLGKSPEEKAEKKRRKHERREMARKIAGTEEGSWWDSVVKFGADMVPKLLPLLIGMGDYTDPDDAPIKTGDVPSSNSFLAATSNGSKGYAVPFMHSHGEKTRITHREYIGDIYSSTSAFVLKSFPLNVGMEETFPWLAAVANSYTSYRLMGAVADFVSQGSDYANTAGLGYVAYGTQYNALAPDFADKREMLNYEFADAVKPSRNMTHWIECKPGDIPVDEKYVRAGSIPTNADLRLYDHGKFFLAVGGNTANSSIIGQFWISYDVELYFPKISGSAAGVINYYWRSADNCTNVLPLGNTQIIDTRSTILPAVLGSGGITFPNGLRGDYSMIILWTSGGATATGNGIPVVGVAGGVTLLGYTSSVGSATQNNLWMFIQLRFTEDVCTMSLTGAMTAIPNLSVCYISFAQIPRAPPASCEIFDYQAQEETERYEKFMSAVQAKELTAMGVKLAEVVPKPKSVVGLKSELLIDPPIPWKRVDGMNVKDHINDENFMFVPAVKGRDLKEAIPAVWCCPSDYEGVLSAREVYDVWAKMVLAITYGGQPSWSKVSDSSTPSTSPDTTSSSSTSPTGFTCLSTGNACNESEDEEGEGEDVYTVLRRVGSYGLCSTMDKYGGIPLHFVVRSFDKNKWKWWFLEEPDPQGKPTNAYETVFLETYEELNGKEFCDVIDVIVDARVKPDREVRSEVETKVARFLFRKRGSKDFSQHAQPK